MPRTYSEAARAISKYVPGDKTSLSDIEDHLRGEVDMGWDSISQANKDRFYDQVSKRIAGDRGRGVQDKDTGKMMEWLGEDSDSWRYYSDKRFGAEPDTKGDR